MSSINYSMRWEAQFTLFQEYIQKNGRFPPLKTVYKGVKIGQWYYNQVSAYRKGCLTDDRLQKLDAIHPAWKDKYRHKSAANKDFLLLSDWKENIPSGEVPIDQVLEGDQLLYCLHQKIFSCKDYLSLFENNFGRAFWKPTGRQTLKYGDLFSFETRKRVFHAQFPMLDFGCFNLYYASSGKRESYVSLACRYNTSGTFSSREEMLSRFQTVLNTLTPKEGEILSMKYMHGLPLREIAEYILSDKPRSGHLLSPSRVHQLEQKALFRLQHPIRFAMLSPLQTREEAL